MKGSPMTSEHPSSRQLSDRVVIVTGAGSGIGRATAIAFAEAGAQVLGVGRRKDALEETAREHPAIAAFAADIGSDDAPETIADAAGSRWGRIDVLVNNAGATAIVPLAEHRVPNRRPVRTQRHRTQLAGPSGAAPAARGARLDREHFQHLRASAAARRTHYAATKSAIEMLTRSWALELAPDRVRVNAVAPGPTESEALAASGLSEALVDQIKQEETSRIPLGRRGKPEEVAAWIVRLADPGSTWLTGQVLTVDGGLELT
jgi:NAD(P)-dependent dehydrogenase (short-subunit alcohol dehydrogenase family)